MQIRCKGTINIWNMQINLRFFLNFGKNRIIRQNTSGILTKNPRSGNATGIGKIDMYSCYFNPSISSTYFVSPTTRFFCTNIVMYIGAYSTFPFCFVFSLFSTSASDIPYSLFVSKVVSLAVRRCVGCLPSACRSCLAG